MSKKFRRRSKNLVVVVEGDAQEEEVTVEALMTTFLQEKPTPKATRFSSPNSSSRAMIQAVTTTTT